MTSYRQNIAEIGNITARIREIERVADEPHAAERVLAPAFEDPVPVVRHRAALLLGERMNPALSDRLAAIVRGERVFDIEPSEPARAAACLALDTEGISERAYDAICDAACDDSSATVRYHALMAVHRNGAIDPTREHDVVEHALRGDSDGGVTVIACQAAAFRGWQDLAEVVDEARARLTGRDAFQAALALAELANMGSTVSLDTKGAITRALLEHLENEETLAAAAHALADLQIHAAVRPLTKIVKGWFMHPILKVDAATALLRLGDPLGAVYLDKVLTGRRKDARGYALELIGKLKLSRFRERVENEARNHGYHADTATIALAGFDDGPAWTMIRELVKTHPDEDVRDLANELLKNTDGKT